MTRSNFKFALQRGLGKCVLALKSTDDIERYQDIVLWGCLKNLSFDAQCEGTRAYYLYTLASFYNDDAYFVNPIVMAFRKMHSSDGWLFSQYCEILLYFAQNGNTSARNILYEKYNVLYQRLHNARRMTQACAFARNDFEELCIILTSLDGIDRFVSIASDMEILFGKTIFSSTDFEWFLDNSIGKFGERRLYKRIIKAPVNLQNFACFFDKVKESSSKTAEQKTTPIPTADDLFMAACNGNLSAAQKIRFSRSAGKEEKEKLAERILTCDISLTKAILLSVFASSGFPLSCETIIADAYAKDLRLRKSAISVLERCEGAAVRALAFELLEKGEYTSSAFCMLVTNYRKEDKELLLKILQNCPVTYSNSSGWHNMVLHILWAFERKACKDYPKELLYYIYNFSLCSCCREYAVQCLAQRKWLTAEIIDECHYDSNEDIRKYVVNIQK